MEVEVLLSCGHICIVPVESVLQLPVIGTEVKCSQCHKTSPIKKVGEPYRVEFYTVKEQDKNDYRK